MILASSAAAITISPPLPFNSNKGPTTNAWHDLGAYEFSIADADGDGLPDAWETDNGLDPNDDGSGDVNNGPDGDPDSDGLTNWEEYTLGTEPDDPDTDTDGMPDGWEVDNDLDPLSDDADDDPDGDLLLNLQEYSLLSNSLTDFFEITTNAAITNLFFTNPNDTDTDDDGLPDGWEVQLGTNGNPIIPALLTDDSDGDGFTNSVEIALGTDIANEFDPVVVDDNGPGDVWPGNPLISDPAENGSVAHPFDAIQKAIDYTNTVDGMTILVLSGEYRGPGNYDINPQGKAVTIRSWNDRDGTVINSGGSGSAFLLTSGETTNTVIKDFSLTTTLNCCSEPRLAPSSQVVKSMNVSWRPSFAQRALLRSSKIVKLHRRSGGLILLTLRRLLSAT